MCVLYTIFELRDWPLMVVVCVCACECACMRACVHAWDFIKMLNIVPQHYALDC